MPDTEHAYAVTVTWTGNKGAGTRTHRGYDRAFEAAAPGKPTIAGSSDPAFRKIDVDVKTGKVTGLHEVH